MVTNTKLATAVLLLALVSPVTGASAQAPAATARLDSGATIRVSMLQSKPRIGQFVGATADELRFLAFPSDLRRVARRDIRQLELRAGINRIRGMRRGATRAGVVFGVVGALLGWGMSVPGQAADGILTAGFAAGAFGTVAGGLVGAAIGSPVWEPVPYPVP